ncbi:MAG: glycosyltransferase family 4 protein [archaeon]|nr:glycosyltransferase family 4 protein [archaeon]
MKVLMISTNLTEAGNVVIDLSKQLVKQGNEVSILAPHEPKLKTFEIIKGVKIHRFTYFFPSSLERIAGEPGIIANIKRSMLAKIQLPFFFLSFVFASFNEIRKADIVHCHWIPSALTAMLPAKILGKKIILTLHGDDIRKLPKFLQKFALKNVEIITSGHEDLIEEAKKIAPEKKIFIIRNMLNFDALEKINNPNELKKEFGIGKEKIVLFVGRMAEMKDPITAAKAIPFVLKKRKDTKFIFVGQGVLEARVKQIIKENKNEANAILAGRRLDVERFHDISDIFIAVSPTQNVFSVTILEAMFKGIPCILTKAGDTEKFFKDKENSLLIDVKNEEQLSNAILKLLEDNTLSAKLAKNGRILLKSLGFEKETILTKTLQLYAQAKK